MQLKNNLRKWNWTSVRITNLCDKFPFFRIFFISCYIVGNSYNLHKWSLYIGSLRFLCSTQRTGKCQSNLQQISIKKSLYCGNSEVQTAAMLLLLQRRISIHALSENLSFEHVKWYVVFIDVIWLSNYELISIA